MVPTYHSTLLRQSLSISGPVPASPTFSYPLTPNTRSAGGAAAAINSVPAPAGPGARDRGVPARPPRLSSYYPGLSGQQHQEEGSGLDASFIVTAAAPAEHSGSPGLLIAPTRSSQYHLPASSSVLLQPENDGGDEEAEVSSRPTNHRPFIANRLDKLPLIAGKSSRIIIPANTFQAGLRIRSIFGRIRLRILQIRIFKTGSRIQVLLAHNESIQMSKIVHIKHISSDI